jgi:hypothetical protein
VPQVCAWILFVNYGYLVPLLVSLYTVPPYIDIRQFARSL